jgi:hypothetical protein
MSWSTGRRRPWRSPARLPRSDPAALRERAVFRVRCSVFEDLAYGLDSGRGAYTAKCLAALDWLLPD